MTGWVADFISGSWLPGIRIGEFAGVLLWWICCCFQYAPFGDNSMQVGF
jgi:hypothetical protein